MHSKTTGLAALTIERSSTKAMIVMAFAQTRASRNGRPNGLGRMVVMGGL